MDLFRMTIASACLTLLAGCNSKYQVSGKVSFSDGKPAYAGTMVVFTSEDGKRSGTGLVIQPDGGFDGVSFEAVGDGLPPGTYHVMLRPPDRINVLPEVARTAPPNFGIQDKYMTAATSGFELTVDRNVTDYDLTLDALTAKDAARLNKSSSSVSRE